MKILAGIPHMGTFPADTVNSLIGVKNPPGTEYMFIGSCLIYKAREMMALEALKRDFTHLLFIDSDMVFPSDAIMRLLNHDKDIVSGRAHKRVYPYDPCFYKSCDWKEAYPYHDYPKGLIEVAASGLAFSLIKREVLEKVSSFAPDGIGEDLAFCKRATEAGFKVWVDTELEIGHIGTAVYGEAHYKHVRGVK